MAQLKYRLDRAEAVTTSPAVVGSVVAASTSNVANLTLTKLDGVELGAGDLCLLAGQEDPKANGIYKFTSGALVRSGTSFSLVSDFVVSGEAKIYKITIGSGGEVNAGKTFIMGVKASDLVISGASWALNTDPITVTEFTPYQLQSKVLTIYAVNYNILRVMSGMASLLFSS